MTHDEILEAAAQIFSQKGFHGASMQDIAEAVHLQKASLYHHVNSKQEILLELLDKALDLMIACMQEVMARPLPTDEKLHQAMVVYLRTLLEHRDLAAVLILEHRSLDPDLRARHILRRDRFEQLWRDLIQQGVNEGLFSCLNMDMTGRALMGVMNWAITWYRPDGKLSPVEIADLFAGLFLDGLLVRQDRPASQG
jgi:TetR/AcrR family transcriptional regulator, cholesterol catabolism regulator